jgi:hypothetical protein
VDSLGTLLTGAVMLAEARWPGMAGTRLGERGRVAGAVGALDTEAILAAM